ncbi:hypothetical protein CHELA40_13113 [Chelatococcus asaccharovorans]|nr:hypothetical protein CHELA40_13113 [Chelatococcus asaccharovorans]CAH1680258.1 hypothetical protein CHELA17_62508 [Chelatococcus asaccharovorans]
MGPTGKRGCRLCRSYGERCRGILRTGENGLAWLSRSIFLNFERCLSNFYIEFAWMNARKH